MRSLPSEDEAMNPRIAYAAAGLCIAYGLGLFAYAAFAM